MGAAEMVMAPTLSPLTVMSSPGACDEIAILSLHVVAGGGVGVWVHYVPLPFESKQRYEWNKIAAIVSGYP
jgi:hypothetical protein